MMESAEKVRLVICPNCKNVLPELLDYSLYQCGGCGTVLRAKDRYMPERCDDDENVGAIREATEGRGVALQNVEPGGVGSLNSDPRSLEELIGYNEPVVGETKIRSAKVVVADADNVNTPGIALNGEDGGFRFQAGCENRLPKMEPLSGWQKSGGGNIGSLKNGCGESHGVRYKMSRYPDEGPSDCSFSAIYDNNEALLPGKHDVYDGSIGGHLLERDRAELLRKLDELKIQLSTAHEDIPGNGSTVYRDAFRNSDAHSPIISSMSCEQFDACRHSAGLLCTNGEDLVYNSDRSMHPAFHYPGFCDRDVMQVHRSCPGLHERVQPHGLISGQYLDPSCDPFGPVPTSSIPHQSTCACFSCVNSHREASAPVPPSAFSRKYPNVSPRKSLHYLQHASGVGCSCIDPRYGVPPIVSHLCCTCHRRPSQLDSEGFTHCRTHRSVTFDGGRRNRPVAGGAPFFTCSCCFELLQLPSKVLLMAKKRGKIGCGACSAVISYDLKNKKLVFSARTEVKAATVKDENSSCEVIKGRYMRSQGYITGTGNRISSDDNDDSGPECLYFERQRVSTTGCNNLSLTKSLEMESTSPSVSDQKNSPAGLDNSGETVQQSVDVNRSPPLSGSPLQEHFDPSSHGHSANRFCKGNRNSRSDHEKVYSSKTILRQNSSLETTLATEMEMPFYESSDNTVSVDSGDASRDCDRLKGNKGESFLSNIFKKSFKDISRSGQGEEHEKGKGEVYVNGHLIPDRLLKKAEKLAGPILAGMYWYDFRAGFWGVMGSPCLGIIPPYIQEFNFPMKEKCAGGDTGVYVNGRELHQKDLDLLASRGLSIDRDRSYMIEITGRVYDEDSGQELDCLGKLAPTVEKAKHGFGMRAPKPVDS